MRRVRVDGLDIAYRRAGQGPPLVLIHGLLCDSRAWRWQIEALSDEFTVVAWDAPGCGDSSDPPPTFDYAKCLGDFMVALDLGPSHVVGLSFGSVLALQLYGHRSELVRSLVLAAAYAGWAGSLSPDEVERRTSLTLAMAGRSPADVADWFIPTLLTEAAPDALRAEIEVMVRDFHPAGVTAMIRAFGPANLRDLLPAIEVPTLLVYGDADARSPLTIAEDFASRIPGARLVVVPGAGHLNNAEAPEAFNAAVRSFLRSG